MPFRLINVGSTYQRTMNKLFARIIGVTLEVYVDDMLVKFVKSVYHIEDLRKTFDRTRLHQVSLNLSKCTFGVQFGKFLGYMISPKGIELNPEKLDAIERIRSPTCHKKVQSLNSRLVSLNRFLAKYGDNSFPFFEVLRANKKFEWMPECEEAFQNLKQNLMTLLPLAKPVKGDTIFLYISINYVVVGTILVKEMAKR